MTKTLWTALYTATLVIFSTSAALALSIETLPPERKPVKRIPPHWQVFQGEQGLVAPHPPGWRIQEFGQGAFAAMHPAKGPAQALVWVKPMQVRQPAEAVLQSLAQLNPAYFPGATVRNQRRLSNEPLVVQAELNYSAGGAPFMGTALCFADQGKGVVYVAAAHEDIYPAQERDMLQILANFYYAAPNTGPKPAPQPQTQLPAMVEFRDPNEGAFSCSVPQGWQVSGGTARPASVDVRHEVLCQSPDGRILLRLGDTAIPPFISPNQMMASFGMGEGQWYNPGYGVQFLVLSYLPGASFLRDYYLPQDLGPLSNVQAVDRPDMSAQTMAQYPTGYVQPRVDTGELTFSATVDGKPKNGYALCQTTLLTTQAMSGGNWTVNILLGYLCEPGLEPTAGILLSRMFASLRFDPQWQMRQSQTAGATSGIVSHTSNEIADMLQQSFENRQRVQDQASESFSRYMRDQVLLEDPETGQRIEAPTGSNYYWKVENSDYYIGTETPDRPNLPYHWVREMEILE